MKNLLFAVLGLCLVCATSQDAFAAHSKKHHGHKGHHKHHKSSTATTTKSHSKKMAGKSDTTAPTGEVQEEAGQEMPQGK